MYNYIEQTMAKNTNNSVKENNNEANIDAQVKANEPIKKVVKQASQQRTKFDIEEKVQTVEHLYAEITSTADKKANKVGEFKFGDDRCVIYFVSNMSGARLHYVWQKDGNLRADNIALPQGEMAFDIIPTSEQDKVARIEDGIKKIKEVVEREG